MFGLKTDIFGGAGNMIWNCFTGPGRVGIQSMYLAFCRRVDVNAWTRFGNSH